jgi:hypothetical protein
MDRRTQNIARLNAFVAKYAAHVDAKAEKIEDRRERQKLQWKAVEVRSLAVPLALGR